jgi:hypothetical protein
MGGIREFSALRAKSSSVGERGRMRSTCHVSSSSFDGPSSVVSIGIPPSNRDRLVGEADRRPRLNRVEERLRLLLRRSISRGGDSSGGSGEPGCTMSFALLGESVRFVSFLLTLLVRCLIAGGGEPSRLSRGAKKLC